MVGRWGMHNRMQRLQVGVDIISVLRLLQVYKATLKGVNPVAVKVLRDQSYTSRDEFSKEVALLKALHNSNIVQFQARILRSSFGCCWLAWQLESGRAFTMISVNLESLLHVPECWLGRFCCSSIENAALLFQTQDASGLP